MELIAVQNDQIRTFVRQQKSFSNFSCTVYGWVNTHNDFVVFSVNENNPLYVFCNTRKQAFVLDYDSLTGKEKFHLCLIGLTNTEQATPLSTKDITNLHRYGYVGMIKQKLGVKQEQ